MLQALALAEAVSCDTRWLPKQRASPTCVDISYVLPVFFSVLLFCMKQQFGVKVQVEYLDGHDLVNGRLSQHTVGAQDSPLHLTLLYRPGHYDILYPLSG